VVVAAIDEVAGAAALWSATANCSAIWAPALARWLANGASLCGPAGVAPIGLQEDSACSAAAPDRAGRAPAAARKVFIWKSRRPSEGSLCNCVRNGVRAPAFEAASANWPPANSPAAVARAEDSGAALLLDERIVGDSRIVEDSLYAFAVAAPLAGAAFEFAAACPTPSGAMPDSVASRDCSAPSVEAGGSGGASQASPLAGAASRRRSWRVLLAA
jgi:hypothetical protein